MYNYDQTCWVPVFGMTTTWNDNMVILRNILSKPLRAFFKDGNDLKIFRIFEGGWLNP